MNKVFAVISAFNEENNIADFIKNLEKLPNPIVFVNDGSTDKTQSILLKHAIYNKQLIILNHSTNLGKGSAMKTGAEYAFKKGAEAIVFMDADNQHSVDDFSKFTDALNKGYQLVFGSRNMTYGVPLMRYLGNKAGSILVSLLFGIYISDLGCGYRGLTKNAYSKVKWESTGYGVETEMVVRTAKNKLNYCEVPVETLYLDKYKGMTVIDALGIFIEVIRLKLSL